MLSSFTIKNLQANSLLNLWERGIGTSPCNRALFLLDAFIPRYNSEALQQLTLGQRNLLLLYVLNHFCKDPVAGIVACQHCKEIIQYQIPVEALVEENSNHNLNSQPFYIKIKDYTIKVRALINEDLLIAQTHKTVRQTREILIKRCILQIKKKKKILTVEQLPTNIITTIGEKISQKDPLAEILLNLVCHNCQGKWSFIFDPGYYLWNKISSYIYKLLEEVHELAIAYGWTEETILKIPAFKRQFYLGKVRGT